ncbi:helix-turn-helix domain-containing protein [Yangia mangrovi]|uniref:Helix-turn-helix domain-containing protein n=1 Tax=Alloyangia mangrovi TaxID=1779329 RepID=A0A2A3K1L5_9RHOB|nr:helix-turn-helix domain-containing protein [Alloyangia mangrovi]
MSKILTVCQVAERWGCSVNAVRNVAQQGCLRHFRVGRLYRFRESEIDLFERGAEEHWRDSMKISGSK